MLLQRADLMGNRRLGHAQPLGRPGIVHGLAQDQEGMEFGIQHTITHYRKLWKDKKSSFHFIVRPYYNQGENENKGAF